MTYETHVTQGAHLPIICWCGTAKELHGVHKPAKQRLTFFNSIRSSQDMAEGHQTRSHIPELKVTSGRRPLRCCTSLYTTRSQFVSLVSERSHCRPPPPHRMWPHTAITRRSWLPERNRNTALAAHLAQRSTGRLHAGAHSQLTVCMAPQHRPLRKRHQAHDGPSGGPRACCAQEAHCSGNAKPCCVHACCGHRSQPRTARACCEYSTEARKGGGCSFRPRHHA